MCPKLSHRCGCQGYAARRDFKFLSMTLFDATKNLISVHFLHGLIRRKRLAARRDFKFFVETLFEATI
jgi:hypothetical protein